LAPPPALLASSRVISPGTAREAPPSEVARLRGGAAVPPASGGAVARLSGRSSVDVFDLATLAGHYRSITGFESACLLAFGLAAFLAGLVLAGLAIVRLVAASASELRTATAVGLTRSQGT